MRRLVASAIALALLMPLSPSAGAVPAERLVTITRDSFGVPHVTGATRDAMAYGSGYVMAMDRLFEMDVIRRLGQGRLSEILGADRDRDGDGVGDLLQADMELRREFYDSEDIARQTAALPDEIRSLLRAFSDGVNQAIAEQFANPTETPALFAALGYVPEPWRPEDSTSVLLLFTMVNFAGEGEGGELENAALLQELVAEHGETDGLEIWQDLVLSNDPGAEAVIDHGEGPAPSRLSDPEPGDIQTDLALTTPSMADAAQAAREAFEVVQRALADLPKPRVGSYAMAATGERTASGGPILFGAPQAGFTAPSTFYEFGLHAPGVDCDGFTVPGLGPFIGIGWCNDHAWTLVAGNAGDQVDVYVEELNPDDPRQYRFDGEWRDMSSRTETYVVKSTVSGEPPEIVTQEVLSTIHGPVFFTDEENNVAYTRRRSQAGFFAQTFEGSHALTYADGFDDVLAGGERITATYNLVYADTAGNISYRFTGWQPVRADGYDLRLPMPGTGEAEWASRSLAFDAMPNVTNPASGVLNVNQGVDSKPISWWPRSSDIFIGRFGHTASDKALFASEHDLDIDRVQTLDRQLISDEDLLTQQLAFVVDGALSGVDPASDLGRAKAIWDDWKAQGFPRVDADGDGLLDHPGVTLFSSDRLNFDKSEVWDRWMDEVWVPTAGRRLPGPYIGRLGMTIATIDAPELYSRAYGADALGAFRRALDGEIAALRGRFDGAPMSDWLTEAPTTSFSAIGLFAPRTMNVVDHGTYQQIVDLGADEGVNILPPGNGRADSAPDIAAHEVNGDVPPHFADQIELYENFDHKPMLFHPGEFTRDAESVEVIVYPG